MVTPGAASARRLLLRSRRSQDSDRRLAGPWAILAPHPDDESLGIGGLLAARAAQGKTSFVAFLTDGSGSHRDAPAWSPAQVGRARRGEARRAMSMLTLASRPLFLGWEDAAPAAEGTALFLRTVARLVVWCRRHRVRTLVTTWVGEPHCDHVAAAMLGRAVSAAGAIRHLEYLVWGWTLADLDQRVRRRRVLSFDVAAGRPLQRRALACHRSQFGGRILGASQRFRLPDAMVGLIGRPNLVLLD